MKKVPQKHGGAITRLEKGESGNPNGRPRITLRSVLIDLQAQGYERATTSDVKAIYEFMITLDEDKLKELVADKRQPMVTRIVGRALLDKRGFEQVEKMLDRAQGKAAQSIDHTSAGEAVKFVVNVSADGGTLATDEKE